MPALNGFQNEVTLATNPAIEESRFALRIAELLKDENEDEGQGEEQLACLAKAKERQGVLSSLGSNDSRSTGMLGTENLSSEMDTALQQLRHWQQKNKSDMAERLARNLRLLEEAYASSKQAEGTSEGCEELAAWEQDEQQCQRAGCQGLGQAGKACSPSHAHKNDVGGMNCSNKRDAFKGSSRRGSGVPALMHLRRLPSQTQACQPPLGGSIASAASNGRRFSQADTSDNEPGTGPRSEQGTRILCQLQPMQQPDALVSSRPSSSSYCPLQHSSAGDCSGSSSSGMTHAQATSRPSTSSSSRPQSSRPGSSSSYRGRPQQLPALSRTLQPLQPQISAKFGSQMGVIGGGCWEPPPCIQQQQHHLILQSPPLPQCLQQPELHQAKLPVANHSDQHTPWHASQHSSQQPGQATGHAAQATMRGQELLDELEAELRALDEDAAKPGGITEWHSDVERLLGQMELLQTGYQAEHARQSKGLQTVQAPACTTESQLRSGNVVHDYET